MAVGRHHSPVLDDIDLDVVPAAVLRLFAVNYRPRTAATNFSAKLVQARCFFPAIANLPPDLEGAGASVER
jgi:hypothetical protein